MGAGECSVGVAHRVEAARATRIVAAEDEGDGDGVGKPIDSAKVRSGLLGAISRDEQPVVHRVVGHSRVDRGVHRGRRGQRRGDGEVVPCRGRDDLCVVTEGCAVRGSHAACDGGDDAGHDGGGNTRTHIELRADRSTCDCREDSPVDGDGVAYSDDADARDLDVAFDRGAVCRDEAVLRGRDALCALCLYVAVAESVLGLEVDALGLTCGADPVLDLHALGAFGSDQRISDVVNEVDSSGGTHVAVAVDGRLRGLVPRVRATCQVSNEGVEREVGRDGRSEDDGVARRASKGVGGDQVDLYSTGDVDGCGDLGGESVGRVVDGIADISGDGDDGSQSVVVVIGSRAHTARTASRGQVHPTDVDGACGRGLHDGEGAAGSGRSLDLCAEDLKEHEVGALDVGWGTTEDGGCGQLNQVVPVQRSACELDHDRHVRDKGRPLLHVEAVGREVRRSRRREAVVGQGIKRQRPAQEPRGDLIVLKQALDLAPNLLG